MLKRLGCFLTQFVFWSECVGMSLNLLVIILIIMREFYAMKLMSKCGMCGMSQTYMTVY